MNESLFPFTTSPGPTERSIVVVEDERVAAEDIRRRLESWGYHVPAIVSSGEEAVQTAERTRPDLLLMDIKLKGTMDGVEAARRIRAKNDIPVIYATSYTDTATLQRAKDTDPLGVINKPYDDFEMRSVIEHALVKRSMERRMGEVEERLRRLLARTADLVLLRRSGKIVAANPSALAILGYALEEISRLDLTDLVMPAYRERVDEALAAAARGERGAGFTLRLQARSGSSPTVMLSIDQLRQGSEPAQQIVMTNLTEKLSAEHEASCFADDLFEAKAEAEDARRQLAEKTVEWERSAASLEAEREARRALSVHLEQELRLPADTLQGLVALLVESGLRPEQYRYVEEMRRVMELLRGLHGRFELQAENRTDVLKLPRESVPVSPSLVQCARPVNGGADSRTSSTLRVLVADDEGINRTIVRRMLESLGCEVEAVGDGSEAVSAAEGRPFDMVFLDCCMPGMDGYAAAAHLRRTLAPASMPHIIAMSADLQASDRTRCLRAGMDDFLPKPLSMETLRTLLQKWGRAPE